MMTPTNGLDACVFPFVRFTHPPSRVLATIDRTTPIFGDGICESYVSYDSYNTLAVLPLVLLELSIFTSIQWIFSRDGNVALA